MNYVFQFFHCISLCVVHNSIMVLFTREFRCLSSMSILLLPSLQTHENLKHQFTGIHGNERTPICLFSSNYLKITNVSFFVLCQCNPCCCCSLWHVYLASCLVSTRLFWSCQYLIIYLIWNWKQYKWTNEVEKNLSLSDMFKLIYSLFHVVVLHTHS